VSPIEVPADWNDVALGITAAGQQQYLLGHRDGHRLGWHQSADAHWKAGWASGVEYAAARDLEFAHIVAQEYQLLESQGERGRDLVRRLLDATRTAENRRKHAQRFERRAAA
jgi:hypothetical protein